LIVMIAVVGPSLLMIMIIGDLVKNNQIDFCQARN